PDRPTTAGNTKSALGPWPSHRFSILLRVLRTVLHLHANLRRPDFHPQNGIYRPILALADAPDRLLDRRTYFPCQAPLVYSGSGSGDKTFDWVLAFCLLVFAALATAIWSLLDRRRENYATLYKWFRLFIRFALASQLVGYGMAKVIPLQMPFPFLTRLLEPFGNFSPMGVLWSSVGASPAYEIFAGSAEMLRGILLIIPWTTTLGALVCLADMTQVFMLNMTYDVPVKLFSFHLLLMALFLLAPELQRLSDFFFRNRTVAPSMQRRLFKTRRANRIAFALQIVFGIWMVGTAAYGGWDDWHQYGGGRPTSALYGIWNVDELSIDGQLRSSLLTD